MSDGVNKVILVGNIGADPELRFTGSGQAVLNIRLATNKTWIKDGEKQERTDWHNVVVWGARAEGLAKFLEKGRTIYVEGELRTSSYGDGDEKKYRTDVNANEVIPMPDGKGRGEGAATGGERAGARKPSGGAAKKSGAARPSPKYEEPAEDAYPD